MNLESLKENKLHFILSFSVPSVIAMLLQTVITITKIGVEYGYSSANFATAFKKQMALQNRKSS